MKALIILVLFYFAFACTSTLQERIPVITTFTGGRPAVLPDSSDPTFLWPKAVADEQPTLAAMESDMISKATHTATANGKWSSSSTWGGSSVPGAGSVVRIPSGISVVYDVDSDVALKDVLVQGTLRWSRDQRTKMRVETIFTTNTSFIDMGTSADPIPESAVSGTPQANIIFEGANPTTTMRLGLVTSGSVRICGAAKPEKLQVSVDPRAGDTTIQLDGDVNKWRVGDKIVVVAMSDAGTATSDPQYTGPTSYFDVDGQAPENSATGHKIGDWAFIGYKKSHDEVRTITAIDGNTITLDTALEFDHISRSATLPRGQNIKITAIVASLSRSIRFESANPTGYRGHNMFMHSDDVIVRWAEALNMGRTRQDPSLYATNNNLLDKEGGVSVMDANNVRGRYPWHTHLAGPSFARKMVIFEGLTAWAPTDQVPQPGWAITQHGGRAAIEKCVVYNVRGAGIVSELGDEIGQWLENVVCWCRGDGFRYGWGRRGERKVNHHGSAGVAYENQARQILQRWNWATSSNIGWSFLQQNNEVLTRVPDHRALRFVDPWAGGGAPGIGDMNEGYGVEQAQIPEWQDNICVGVGDGFFVAHRQYTNREDQLPMIARNYHCIGVSRPVHIENYSWWYSFYDFVWIDGKGGSAIAYGDKTAAFNHANGYVRGYSRVADIKGYMVDGWFALIDHDCTDPNPYKIANVTMSATNYNDPTTHKLYVHSQRMGGWVKFGDNIIQPRPSPFKNENEINFDPATFTLKNITNNVLDANTNRVHPVSFKGTITDGFGTRPYPHWSWFDAPADEGVREYQRSTEIPQRIVERNGCFYDEAEEKWKSRMYFIDHNRLTGDYLIIPFDLTLKNFNTTFLEVNKIVPQPPSLPLIPESISDDGSVPPPPAEEPEDSPDVKSAVNGSNRLRLLSPLVIVLVTWTLYF